MNTTKPWELQESETDVLEAEGSQLIIYNDNVNTFDWVIECLIDICGHSLEQAEQCSLIIHYKGKCSVDHGSRESLLPKKNSLVERGLSAVVD